MDGERRGYSLSVSRRTTAGFTTRESQASQMEKCLVLNPGTRRLSLSLSLSSSPFLFFLPSFSSASAKKRRAAHNRITSAEGRHLVKIPPFVELSLLPARLPLLSLSSPNTSIVPIPRLSYGQNYCPFSIQILLHTQRLVVLPRPFVRPSPRAQQEGSSFVLHPQLPPSPTQQQEGPGQARQRCVVSIQDGG